MLSSTLQPTGFSRLFAIIGCVTANACIAATLVSAMPVILTTNLGATYIETSAFLVAGALSTTVLAHWIGKWSDSGASRRRIAGLSAIAGAVGFLAMAILESYLGFLLVFVTAIAFANSLFPQFMALVFVLASKHVPLARAFASLGWVIGPPIAGFSIAEFGYVSTFQAIAVLYGILLLTILLALPASAAVKDAAKDRTGNQKVPVRRYLDLIVILSCIHLLIAVPLFAIPLRMIEIGGTQTQVGLAFGIAALIEIPIIAMSGRFQTLWSSRAIFAGSSLGLATFFIALILATSPNGLIAANILNGIVTGVMAGYGLIVIQERLSKHPGFASALYTNILRLTHLAAVFLAGVIAQYLTFDALFAIAAGLAVLIFAALAFIPAIRGQESNT